jgi:hypothetical protein
MRKYIALFIAIVALLLWQFYFRFWRYNGKRIRSTSSEEQYIVSNGIKHWLSTWESATKRGYHTIPLEILPDKEFTAIPTGKPLS